MIRKYVLVPVSAVLIAVCMAVFTGVTTASAAPLDYGGGCVLYPDNRAATVDSLRFRCTWAQQDQVFLAADAGAVPMGAKNGWVIRPPAMPEIASGLWIGKTFHTGPDGGYLDNRLTGAGLEFYRANVYRAPSIWDGRTSWALDYVPSPTPPLWDEIREVTPGVWLGFSWWRGILAHPQLLGFVLA